MNGVDRAYFALHIPSFEQGLGGKQVDVDFIARLSDQESFESVDKLVEQLLGYTAEARTVLAEWRTRQRLLRKQNIEGSRQ